MNEFENDLLKAVDEYGEEHVDIILDYETGFMYGNYHSYNDSYPLTNKYQIDRLNAINLADELGIGWAEL